jgi:hypothetical protein
LLGLPVDLIGFLLGLPLDFIGFFVGLRVGFRITFFVGFGVGTSVGGKTGAGVTGEYGAGVNVINLQTQISFIKLGMSKQSSTVTKPAFPACSSNPQVDDCPVKG